MTEAPNEVCDTLPMQFGARLVLGGLSGAAIGAAHGAVGNGLIAGLIGTLGGARVRGGLARAFGRAQPAALIEDAVAIVGAVLIVMALR